MAHAYAFHICNAKLKSMGRQRKTVQCDYDILINLSFQFNLNAPHTQHHSPCSDDFGKKRSITKTPLARSTAKAFVMPFTTESLNVLPNNRLPAFLALRSPTFRTFSLTAYAPGIAILLDV
jgi:hypothetical protein